MITQYLLGAFCSGLDRALEVLGILLNYPATGGPSPKHVQITARSAQSVRAVRLQFLSGPFSESNRKPSIMLRERYRSDNAVATCGAGFW
jgi:hypothetical protein